MWLKLFFLLLYFLVLFVLARFFEAVVWYETGIFATQLVDPVTLSFKKLKTILEGRGLGYSGLAEKRDVRELVENSGNLVYIPRFFFFELLLLLFAAIQCIQILTKKKPIKR